ncbi:MAG: carbamoyltransferase HypF [Solirubrobacteraceae bacterium]
MAGAAHPPEAANERVRARARIQGTVQGVGFRPFVYRLAHEQALTGYVLNDEHGVLLEVEGRAGAVERFLERLVSELPPLASIDALTRDSVTPRGDAVFEIRKSSRAGVPDALVTPDSAPCPECLAELRDPDDRRYRYPFINCTNCGPRFTIVRDVPYDRPLTTMAPFAMCPECRAEYEDPGHRRFHAQPNACPVCGPRVEVVDAHGELVAGTAGEDSITWIAGRLAAGAIVAVKGLGGFHLVCDAADAATVSALRARKHREDKPFALMVGDVEHARRLVALGPDAEALLRSPARPIVLAARLPGAPVAAHVAPGAPELGVMLPYTPLHELVLSDFAHACTGNPAGALVMTSGNVSDEPIAYRDADALGRLAAIADLFLVHDREIETRTDDSVVRAVHAEPDSDPATGQRQFLRRSRGYVPGHLTLPVPAPEPLLACGAEQKNTFCVAKGARAWVGHHIGDLEHYATLQAFIEGIEHFERLFAVTPELVAYDLHPDYLSTKYALEREGVRTVGIQHHHAHLAACLAEHGVHESQAVGAIFDGTGYGTDATVWGGELLVGDLTGFDRAGSLSPVRMPGGAAAIRQPWRMASAWLTEAFGEPQRQPPGLASVDDGRWRAINQIAASAELSPVTSSMGRLFDAVAAMCGLSPEVSYEGQAAVELEAAAWQAGGRAGEHPAESYEIQLDDTGERVILDPRAALRAVAADLMNAQPVPLVAARFHSGVARATTKALVGIADERGLETAVLSGGVFQNRLLLELVAGAAAAAGLRVLIPSRLPPNDGGISFGQAAIAAAREARVGPGDGC